MVKFVMDKKGVKKEVLQANWMKDFIENEANKQSNDNSTVKAFIGFDRAKAIIYPNTKEQKK